MGTCAGRGGWGLMALLGAIGVSGCAPAGNPGGGDAGGPRVIFITNAESDWWTAVEKGMKDSAGEFGVRAEMRRNNQGTSGQIRLLKEVVGRPDVKGVAVSVYESDAPGIADAMGELKEAGKFVIAIDSDVAPTRADVRRAYIGTFNTKAGAIAGRVAAQLRPEGGKVVVFVGTAAAANARDREAGFFSGAGEKFERLEVSEDRNDKTIARRNVVTMINKHGDEAGLFLGLWSYNAPAIAEGFAANPEARKKVNVVTFDLDEKAVGALAAGQIDATVCQNPYEMGYQGVRLLKAYIEGDEGVVKEILKDGDGTHDTGVRVIVPDADSPVKGDDVITIDEMKTWMASKGLKSS